MASIEVKDASGKKVSDTELSAAVFGIEPNVHVMHARRALAVLVRVRFVLHNGQVAVPYSVLILAPMPLRFLQR